MIVKRVPRISHQRKPKISSYLSEVDVRSATAGGAGRQTRQRMRTCARPARPYNGGTTYDTTTDQPPWLPPSSSCFRAVPAFDLAILRAFFHSKRLCLAAWPHDRRPPPCTRATRRGRTRAAVVARHHHTTTTHHRPTRDKNKPHKEAMCVAGWPRLIKEKGFFLRKGIA
jgi:hypothetical protein